MAFNYAKLKGRIIEIFGNNGSFIDAMGWSRPTFSRKISGESEWTDNEIFKAAELLKIDVEKIHIYFFVVSVQD
ncbi:MAG: DUF739 family protein [Alphaproteobacteria bacterium]|nr:DUF739 family protein [Alphaproteobacteria bacterium]